MSALAPETRLKEPGVTWIRPTRGWGGLQLGELWRFRELFFFLVWRDIKVRYKQTLLGAAWAILQPLLTMVVFSIFFGELAKMPTDGIPYPIFSYSALLPWQLFESGVSKAGTSLVAGRNLITKVYFPRLAVPAAPVLAGAVDFCLALLVLFVMMAYYHTPLTWTVLTLPLFLLLALVTAMGTGFWLAALNVAYRDVGYVIPFLVRVWFFCTPITYAISIVPARWQAAYWLNPMVGVTQGFRWAILGVTRPPAMLLLASAVVALLLLGSGIAYFRRMERTFADVV
jgi:lipopolysaccharide transport system permease protein